MYFFYYLYRTAQRDKYKRGKKDKKSGKDDKLSDEAIA